MDFPIFSVSETVLAAILLHIPVICKELVTRQILNCLVLAFYILKSSSHNNRNFYSALFFIHIWGKFLDLILLMNKIRVGHWGYVGKVVNFSPACLFLLFGSFQCFLNINLLYAFKIKVKQTSMGVACPITSLSQTPGHSQLIQRSTSSYFHGQSDRTSSTSSLGNPENQSLHNCLCPLLEFSHFWGQAQQLFLCLIATLHNSVGGIQRRAIYLN